MDCFAVAPDKDDGGDGGVPRGVWRIIMPDDLERHVFRDGLRHSSRARV